ncbi:MAG TPA: patatin-like phospholipase family protein [Bacillota bacterium]
MVRKKVGLALGGGAAKGLAHLGVLAVLEERGMPVDYVAGTSVGSIIGALYSAGLTVDEIRRSAERVRWRNLLRLTVPREGVVTANGLEAQLSQLLGEKTFDQLRVPFAAVSVDVITGEVLAINEGRVVDAVRASCAVPGIFSPVRLDGRLLVDGGLLNSVPSDVVRAMGADLVIAVDLSGTAPAPRVPSGIFQIILRSIEIMQRANHAARPETADLVIRPQFSAASVIDLDHQELFIDCGRRAAEEALALRTQEDMIPVIAG